MDSADALRLVVFEYLLPDQRIRQRRRNARFLADAFLILMDEPAVEPNIPGLFEILLLYSDRLLHVHGFATSFVQPRPLRSRRSLCVRALVDVAPHRAPVSDPFGGVRV